MRDFPAPPRFREAFSASPGMGIVIRLSNEGVSCRSSVNSVFARLMYGTASPELNDRLGNATEPESRVCIADREFDTAPLVLVLEGLDISGLFNSGRPI